MGRNKFRPRPSQELCPFETMEWEKLRTKWNCTDPADYHCLPDQYNVPGQICVKPIWVSKNKCPMYITKENMFDLIPCDLQYGACSDKDYRSNEVFKYPGCLNKTESFKESSTLKPEPPILPLPHMAGVIAAVVVVLCLLVMVPCIIKRRSRRRRRRRKEKQDKEYHQLQPLLDQSSFPVGLQKVMDYVKSGVFSSSKFYDHAIGVLDIHGCVSLIGPPGSGKTLTAVQLAVRKYRGGQGGMSRLIVYHTVKELTETEPPNGAYIIVDDWLDQYMHYPIMLKEDKKQLEESYDEYIKMKNVHIIFTAQEDKWKMFNHDFSECALFVNDSLLTINSKAFKKTELKSIIHNNLSVMETRMETKLQNKFENKMLELEWEEEFSFPLIVNVICVNRRLAESLGLIVKDGFTSILKQFFDSWSKDKDIDERRSFCILVFAAFLGGNVNLSNFKRQMTGHVYERICSEYACEKSVEKSSSKGQEFLKADECINSKGKKSDEQPIISDGIEDITKANSKQVNKTETSLAETASVETLLQKNQRLRACLFKVRGHEEDPVFVFQHNALQRCLLQYIIISKKEKFFIENASIEVLRENCWIEEGIARKFHAKISDNVIASPVGLVIIPTKALVLLAERIYSETKGFIQPQWSQHVFMSHKTFCETWKKVVKKNSREELS
ncbi:uncharacterized protein LOC144625936 [Crassostrea virginica]